MVEGHDGAGNAQHLLWLSGRRHEWVQRRIERISFDTERTLCRSSTYEIVFSRDDLDGLPTFQGRLAVPLAEVLRSPPRHIVLSEPGSEKPIQLLLRAEERSLLIEALVDSFSEQTADLDISADERRDLQHDLLLQIEPELTVGQQDAAVLRPGLKEAWQLFKVLTVGYLEARVLVALLPNQGDAAFYQVTEAHSERIRIRPLNMGSLRAPTSLAHARWKLMTGLNEQSPRSTRRRALVLDGSAMRSAHLSGGSAEHVFRHRLWPRRWIPDTYLASIPLEGLLQCRSFHVEFACPPGLYVKQAVVSCFSTTGESQTLVLIDNDERRPDRAHMHLPRSAIEMWGLEPALRGELGVALRPTYHDGLRLGQNISVISALSLWFITLTDGWASAGFRWHLTDIHVTPPTDASALVAFLVVAPTIVIAGILRQSEHPVTKTVLSHYRSRVALTGVAFFAVALAVAVDVTGHLRFWIMFGASTVVTLLGIQTCLSAQYSRLSRGMPRLWRSIRQGHRPGLVKRKWRLLKVRLKEPRGNEVELPTLTIGDSRHPKVVQRVQALLNQVLALDPPLALDGRFGGKTEDAVKRLQDEFHLFKDGVVGTDTWQALLGLRGIAIPRDAPSDIDDAAGEDESQRCDETSGQSVPVAAQTAERTREARRSSGRKRPIASAASAEPAPTRRADKRDIGSKTSASVPKPLAGRPREPRSSSGPGREPQSEN